MGASTLNLSENHQEIYIKKNSPLQGKNLQWAVLSTLFDFCSITKSSPYFRQANRGNRQAEY